MEEQLYEAYGALDVLLDAIGNLPLKFIRERPPLDRAVATGHQVVDDAVRHGRYDPGNLARREGD